MRAKGRYRARKERKEMLKKRKTTMTETRNGRKKQDFLRSLSLFFPRFICFVSSRGSQKERNNRARVELRGNEGARRAKLTTKTREGRRRETVVVVVLAIRRPFRFFSPPLSDPPCPCEPSSPLLTTTGAWLLKLVGWLARNEAERDA